MDIKIQDYLLWISSGNAPNASYKEGRPSIFLVKSLKQLTHLEQMLNHTLRKWKCWKFLKTSSVLLSGLEVKYPTITKDTDTVISIEEIGEIGRVGNRRYKTVRRSTKRLQELMTLPSFLL